jgi:hypothetical protein
MSVIIYYHEASKVGLLVTTVLLVQELVLDSRLMRSLSLSLLWLHSVEKTGYFACTIFAAFYSHPRVASF